MFMVHGYFQATMAELNGCDRDHPATTLKIFDIWPFVEIFLTPDTLPQSATFLCARMDNPQL